MANDPKRFFISLDSAINHPTWGCVGIALGNYYTGGFRWEGATLVLKDERYTNKLAELTRKFKHVILHAHSNGRDCVVIDHQRVSAAQLAAAIDTYILAPGQGTITRFDILACSLGVSSYGADFRTRIGLIQASSPTVYTPKYPVTIMQGTLCLEKAFRGYNATFASLKPGDIVNGSTMAKRESYDKVTADLTLFKRN